MQSKKIHIPSEYLDAENKVITSPKIEVSSFNFEIGAKITEGDLLYKLDLLLD